MLVIAVRVGSTLGVFVARGVETDSFAAAGVLVLHEVKRMETINKSENIFFIAQAS
jgi:hypothetical protein